MKVSNIVFHPPKGDEYYKIYGLSYSRLAKAMAIADGTYEPISFAAGNFGNLVHDLILEGIEGEFKNQNELNMASGMQRAIIECGLLPAMKKEAIEYRTELDITFDVDDVKCKSKVDCYLIDANQKPVFYDLKTTYETTKQGCLDSFKKYNYMLQAGFYSLATGANSAVYEFVTKRVDAKVFTFDIKEPLLKKYRTYAYECILWYKKKKNSAIFTS